MTKIAVFCLSIIFLCFVNTSGISAQIVLNEVYFNGGSADNNDWLELYNNSSTEINLFDWHLTDITSAGEEKTLKQFEENFYIPANGYCIYENRNRLNNGGDTIRLYQNNNLIDCFSYGNGGGFDCSGKKHDLFEGSDVYARNPEGSGDFVKQSASKAISNLCSTKTPQPTPAPTKQPTDKPTPAPTAVMVISSTPDSQSPTSKPTSTPEPEVKALETQDDQTNQDLPAEKATNNLPGFVMVAGGAGLSGYGIFLLLNKLRDKYNEGYEQYKED